MEKSMQLPGEPPAEPFGRRSLPKARILWRFLTWGIYWAYNMFCSNTTIVKRW